LFLKLSCDKNIEEALQLAFFHVQKVAHNSLPYVRLRAVGWVVMYKGYLYQFDVVNEFLGYKQKKPYIPSKMMRTVRWIRDSGHAFPVYRLLTVIQNLGLVLLD
jgi:hypothetical protein